MLGVNDAPSHQPVSLREDKQLPLFLAGPLNDPSVLFGWVQLCFRALSLLCSQFSRREVVLQHCRLSLSTTSAKISIGLCLHPSFHSVHCTTCSIMCVVWKLGHIWWNQVSAGTAAVSGGSVTFYSFTQLVLHLLRSALSLWNIFVYCFSKWYI